MNKYMKKLAAGLLAFALMVMLLPAGVVVSFAASGKLSFSDPTASVGDQISVTMRSRICPRHRFCGGCGPEDVQLYIKI